MSTPVPCIPTPESTTTSTRAGMAGGRVPARRVLERTVITREYVLTEAPPAEAAPSFPSSAEVAPSFRSTVPGDLPGPSALPERVIDGVLARVGMWLIDRSAARAERREQAAARHAAHPSQKAAHPSSPRPRRPHRTAPDIADRVDAGRTAHLKHFISLPH